MADEIKKENNEEIEEFENPIGKAIFENYTQNEDLVDYIHEDSLSKLMSKYAEAEEDENIREGWNDPAQTKTEMEKGQTSKFTSYYYSPDEIRKDSIPDATPGLADSFENATSAYDNDKILFGDIDLDSKKSPDDAPVPMSQMGKDSSKPQIEVIDDNHPSKFDEHVALESDFSEEPIKPAPKRRGRPPKAKAETGDTQAKPEPKRRGRPPKAKAETGDAPAKPAPKKRGRPPKAKAEQEQKPMIIEKEIEGEKREGRYSISDKYYTNTKVVFTDEGLNDGIRRHTEDEVSGAFSKPKKKRRGLFGRWK